MKEYTDWKFNPFEIGFCGYSGSGKTTLICRLIRKLSSKYRIGYLKHDAHHFQMDHRGKDTFRAYGSGAQGVFISDGNHFASVHRSAPSADEIQRQFTDSDFLFAEGYKADTLPKIILIDRERLILRPAAARRLTHVIALAGPTRKRPGSFPDVPYFHRDDIASISEFILARRARVAAQLRKAAPGGKGRCG